MTQLQRMVKELVHLRGITSVFVCVDQAARERCVRKDGETLLIETKSPLQAQ